MIKHFGVDVDGAGSGWVVVFPRGKHYINKYQMVLNCDDKFFKSIEKWWGLSTFKKPYLDKGHDFDEKFGEFTEYRITEKGLEMFLILNEAGKELVKSGKYEYLSPTFNDAKDSNGVEFKNVIFSVSLVNYPALLVLDKIQQQIALSFDGEPKNLKGGSKMDLREMIASKLKLNLAADDSSILAKVEQLLNESADIEELKAKIEELKAQIGSTEAQLKAAEEEKTKVCAMLDTVKKDQVKAEAERIIDEAIRFQQYHPSLKEMKMELYMVNPEMVKKELALLPKKDKDKQITTLSVIDGLELSVEDQKILSDAGYDLSKPEDLKLAKQYLEATKEVK